MDLEIEPLLDAADSLAASAFAAIKAKDAAAAAAAREADDDHDDHNNDDDEEENGKTNADEEKDDPSRPRPDLPLPSDYDPATPHRIMELYDHRRKGRGWRCKVDSVPAGTVLLVEKPSGMVMGWE
eukprot:CAMPEP_0183297394 /NCGR_PEP_ID=MMETSP0160_2-20130417/4704_1 /TAXON_ID=2839 ORGANISM="Odontella Sinensis, Strain Grunow 1884" /NCGR_SAMPLE_ID=MMETSP0160_2 /ASSEMBLY_ACC=CAM_ASM_000250 /LENGTH=125 /DNA_ID=CAMNT_0025459209 /DNA_START=86 /DNA_END=460 /DNA_ORIENTATION=+